MRIEAPENRSLPAIIATELRQAMLKLSLSANAGHLAKRSLRALAGFAKRLKLKYNDIEVGLDFDPEPALADNGDLELGLQDLFETAGLAARSAGTALSLFVDELQYVKEPELAALITALHRTAQSQLPVVMVGAGLPQLRGLMGNAKSYAERMFDFPEIGPLSPEAARQALDNPARHEGAEFTAEALDRNIARTRGYPYFLQEWGKHSWNAATKSPITLLDVEQASRTAIAALDDSLFWGAV